MAFFIKKKGAKKTKPDAGLRGAVVSRKGFLGGAAVGGCCWDIVRQGQGCGRTRSARKEREIELRMCEGRQRAGYRWAPNLEASSVQKARPR